MVYDDPAKSFQDCVEVIKKRFRKENEVAHKGIQEAAARA
jgi:hypothetical protein